MIAKFLIAAFIPPEPGDRYAREVLSHMSPAGLVLTLIICAAIVAWFFQNRRR